MSLNVQVKGLEMFKVWIVRVILGLAEKAVSGECVSEPQCPHPCRCADGIVDCREKGLTQVPDHMPEATTEMYGIIS